MAPKRRRYEKEEARIAFLLERTFRTIFEK